MPKKKPDSVCFDISTLKQDQKVTFAKSLKKTVDNFNKELEPKKEKSQEEESE